MPNSLAMIPEFRQLQVKCKANVFKQKAHQVKTYTHYSTIYSRSYAKCSVCVYESVHKYAKIQV